MAKRQTRPWRVRFLWKDTGQRGVEAFRTEAQATYEAERIARDAQEQRRAVAVVVEKPV